LGRKDKRDIIIDEPSFVREEVKLTRIGQKEARKKRKKTRAKHVFVVLQIIFCLAIAWFFLPGFRDVFSGEFGIFEENKPYILFEQKREPQPLTIPDEETIEEQESDIGEPISTVMPEPSEKPDYFATKNSYTSDKVDILIEKVQEDGKTYYIADVKIKDMSFIRSGIYRNSNGVFAKEDVVKTAIQNNAVLAINTDYYTYRNSGYIIRNGKVLVNDGWGDVLCLFEDGRMEAFQTEYNAYELKDMGVVESFSFGPILIEDGAIIRENLRGNSNREVRHPRTGVGYYSPGHYLFITVDGRKEGYSEGMSITEFAELFASLGCEMAYNLDGGGSTTMAFMGELVNRPEGTTYHLRNVDGILYIWDEVYNMEQ